MIETTQARLAKAIGASGVLCISRTVFAARRPVDPPADAPSDTSVDMERALTEGWGVCTLDDDHMIGCLLVVHDGEAVRLRRVSALPSEARRGIVRTMIGGTIPFTMDAGLERVEVLYRREFPEFADWWGKHGLGLLRGDVSGIVLGRDLPVAITTPIPDAVCTLGVELAGLLRAGGVIIATGELGAGKTTLARGIGKGLGVEGPVILPTFVLSYIHPSRGGGPDPVHMDAYRMAGTDGLTDIDLDATPPGSVALIRRGEGIIERLSDERLEIDIDHEIGDEARRVILTGTGPRWAGILEALRRNL